MISNLGFDTSGGARDPIGRDEHLRLRAREQSFMGGFRMS